MCTERKATGLFVLADFLCDNGCVPVKNYFAFLIHVVNEIQLSSIYLLITCFDLRKIS